MISIGNFIKYLKNHPNFIVHFLRDIRLVWWWRILRQPIVVLTTESGGLGDYLWFRSYYDAIRNHFAPQKCRIIVIGMCQWESLAMVWDSNKQKNHFDVYRAFESPDNPLKMEALFFKLFKADVYVDFRVRHIQDLARAKEHYLGKGYYGTKQYYEIANNAVLSQWFTLPKSFRHKPPLLPITDISRSETLNKPYVVVVEKGNTQGKLSYEQTSFIVNYILSKGFSVFFNGNFNEFISKYTEYDALKEARLIDGYSYPLEEYPTIVNKSQFVVTVNTFIYHLAIQLGKPVVVISANEYESIKMDAPNQMIVFNDELQQAYETSTLASYQNQPNITLKDINCNFIDKALQQIEHYL